MSDRPFPDDRPPWPTDPVLWGGRLYRVTAVDCQFPDPVVTMEAVVGPRGAFATHAGWAHMRFDRHSRRWSRRS